jgi:site-specific DNA-cytosine methylase
MVMSVKYTDPLKISDEKLDRLIPDHTILVAGFPCQPFSLQEFQKRILLEGSMALKNKLRELIYFAIKVTKKSTQ